MREQTFGREVHSFVLKLTNDFRQGRAAPPADPRGPALAPLVPRFVARSAAPALPALPTR